jgi:hypothetical protein
VRPDWVPNSGAHATALMLARQSVAWRSSRCSAAVGRRPARLPRCSACAGARTPLSLRPPWKQSQRHGRGGTLGAVASRRASNSMAACSHRGLVGKGRGLPPRWCCPPRWRGHRRRLPNATALTGGASRGRANRGHLETHCPGPRIYGSFRGNNRHRLGLGTRRVRRL